MKVLNLMWGFNSGGVGKCFLIYAGLGKIEPELEIKSVVINLRNVEFDFTPLSEIGATILNIRNRLDFSWVGQLRKILEEFQPDAIFTHAFNGPVVAMIERLFYHKKIKLLCSYHGKYHAPSASRRLLQPLFNGVVNFIYRNFADGVMTVCDDCKEYLANSCHIPRAIITTIYNGIYDICPTFQQQKMLSVYDKQHPFVLGIISRLVPIKGIPYLFDALTELRDIPLHLIIAGDGPERRKLEELAKKKQLKDQIEFVGFQNNISDCLKQFDVYLLPSLAEYHSIALLEAMSCGKPVIATDVGGNRESIRNHEEGLLVPPRESKAIADAIRYLYENQSVRMQLGMNARNRFLQDFTEDRMTRNLAGWLLSFH